MGGTNAGVTMPGFGTLNNLTIQNAQGVALGGNVAVHGTLALNSGTFTLKANELDVYQTVSAATLPTLPRIRLRRTAFPADRLTHFLRRSKQ